MTDLTNKKPRLAETGQGFSVLKTVEYNGRFLYSKYSPDKAIETTVEKLNILPGTIILINSPALWYGLESLFKKTPEDCIFIALEADTELYNFSKDFLPQNHSDKIIFLNACDVKNLDTLFRKLTNTGKYRRLLSIDFSAGINFHKEVYLIIKNGLQEIIERFWKNRITLTKLGKLYSKNTIKNLPALSSHPQLWQLEKTISKPILVCGAGESLDSFFKTDSKGEFIYKDLINSNFYIIAADACYKTLLSRGIHVHSAVLLEAQFAITKAFLGIEKSETTLFMDICSRADIKDFVSDKTVFFATKYASSNFLNELSSSNIIHNYISGTGSVGIAALEIAKKLRCNNNIPIFIIGMDFSYSLGRTHCKGTFQDNTRFTSTNRVCSTDNAGPAITGNAASLSGKDSKKIYTTPILASYASLTSRMNENIENIYDLGTSGIDLGFNFISSQELISKAQSWNFNTNNETSTVPSAVSYNDINKLLKSHLSDLLKIKSLLTCGTDSPKYNKELSLQEQLELLLIRNDFLYLHFPDGHKLSMNTAYLKRIRAETDTFIKLFENACNSPNN